MQWIDIFIFVDYKNKKKNIMRLNVGARGWLLLIMPLYYYCRLTAIVQLLLLWVLSVTRRLLQAAIITRWPTILQCCHGLYQDHASSSTCHLHTKNHFSSNMKFQIIKQKWVFLFCFNRPLGIYFNICFYLSRWYRYSFSAFSLNGSFSF